MRHVTVAALALAFLLTLSADAQQVLVGTSKNRAVEATVAEISPARIEATIRKLASFGTRHTLSDPDHPNRGIGAARRWIKAELESYAKESGGRLIVRPRPALGARWAARTMVPRASSPGISRRPASYT